MEETCTKQDRWMWQEKDLGFVGDEQHHDQIGAGEVAGPPQQAQDGGD